MMRNFYKSIAALLLLPAQASAAEQDNGFSQALQQITNRTAITQCIEAAKSAKSGQAPGNGSVGGLLCSYDNDRGSWEGVDSFSQEVTVEVNSSQNDEGVLAPNYFSLDVDFATHSIHKKISEVSHASSEFVVVVKDKKTHAITEQIISGGSYSLSNKKTFLAHGVDILGNTGDFDLIKSNVSLKNLAPSDSRAVSELRDTDYFIRDLLKTYASAQPAAPVHQ